MSETRPDPAFRLPSGPGIALAHGCGGGYRGRPPQAATSAPPSGAPAPTPGPASSAAHPPHLTLIPSPPPGELP